MDDGLSVFNDTDFGLRSNAWTGDPSEQDRFVEELRAGLVFVNGMVASYPAPRLDRTT